MSESVGSRVAPEWIRGVRPLTVRILSTACAAALVAGCASSAPATSFGQPSPTATEPAAQRLEITAEEFAFSTDTLEAVAGRPIVIVFTNNDQVRHNVKLFSSEARDEVVFFGDLLEGPATVEYEVGALEPGTYRFECHPHADLMNGLLEVTAP